MDINGYLNEIRALAASGQATEHSYRPALERLFKSIDADVTVINEPKRLTDVGAPDFVFSRNGVSVGWCEAKDLTKVGQKILCCHCSLNVLNRLGIFISIICLMKDWKKV